MATRVGIELSPTACRIVEVDAGPAWGRRSAETRVRSFAELPPSGPETDAKLASLKGRRAAVVIWAEPSDHRQVMVPAGSYESMRKAALKGLGAAGVQTRGMWADIAPARGHGDDSKKRRPVVVTLAPADAMTSALQPLLDAGIKVRTVLTPAAALGSLAHLRRPLGEAGAIEAYVALEETATCVALVRDGMLMAARDLGWGYLDEAGDGRQVRRREHIAVRLADELGELFASVSSAGGGAVGVVSICGGLEELRSMTAPVMERLDVEVETLDSLFGIDETQLPEPGDEFRERSAGLRLAWAAVADSPPPINLLRARRRVESKAIFGRAAVAAGMAAGLSVGWVVVQSSWWRATDPKPATRIALARNTRPAPVPAPMIVSKTPPLPPPALASKPTVTVTPPPVVASKPTVTAAPPPLVASKPTVTAASPPLVVSKPTVTTAPPPLVVASKPMVTTATPPPVAANRPTVTTAEPAPLVVRKAPLMPAPPPVVAKAPVTVAPPALVAKATATAALPTATSKPATTAPPLVVASKPARAASAPSLAANRTGPVPPPPVVPRVAEPVPERAPSVALASNRTVAPRQSEAPKPEPAIGREARAAIVAPPIRQEPRMAAVRARPAPAPEVALPFDAALGTILYSADRRLAIVDGKIVGIGDVIRDARVIDITPGAVLLRDAQGRLRRLALGAGGR